MVKSPASFGVPLSADSRPAFDAPRVLPMDNAQARAAQQLGGATVDAGLGTLRLAQASREREAQAMEELKRRTDRARAQEADSKIADGYREILSGKEGYRTMLGRRAVDGRDMTLEAVERHRARILDLLSPEQREMVAASEATRYQHARETIDAHYAQQVRIDEQASSEARAEGGMRDAVDGYFTPTVRLDGGDSRSLFEDNRKAVHTELMSLAASRGLSKDSADALLRQADENMYGGVMRRLVEEGNAREAQAFYEENKDKFSEQARARFSDGLTTAVAKQDASELAAELTSTQPTLMGRLDELQKRGVDGLVFAETLKALTQRDQQLEEARHRAQNSAWQKIEQHAQANGGVLDAEHQQLVKDAQLTERFNLFMLRGQQRVTTEYGWHMVSGTSGKDLRDQFASKDALRNRMEMEVTPSQLGDLMQRWDNAATALPKLDKSIVMADRLREAIGWPPDKEIPVDTLKRWNNEVDTVLRRMIREKPTATEESLWSAAADEAAQKGYFTSPSAEPSNFKPFFMAKPEDAGGSVYIKSADGSFIEARLDDIVPGTSLTWRQATQEGYRQQALVAEDGKPKGSVRLADGRVIPYAELTPADIVQTATLSHIGRERMRNNEMRAIGLQELRKSFDASMRKSAWGHATTLPGDGSASTFTVPKDLPDKVRREAQLRVWGQRADWVRYGLTTDDMRAVLGEPPPAAFDSSMLRRSGL